MAVILLQSWLTSVCLSSKLEFKRNFYQIELCEESDRKGRHYTTQHDLTFIISFHLFSRAEDQCCSCLPAFLSQIQCSHSVWSQGPSQLHPKWRIFLCVTTICAASFHACTASMFAIYMVFFRAGV